MHGAILRLTDMFESVEFAYKPKRKNRMAHELARLAAKELPPIFREDLVEIITETDTGQQLHPSDADKLRR